MCSTASAFQSGCGESTKKGSSKKKEVTKKNSGTKSDNTTPPRPSATSRTKVVTDIRQVDFKNFSYFIEGHTHNGRFFPAQMVALRDGAFVIMSHDHSYRKHYIELEGEYPRFGDLTNDGKDEAVVLVNSGGDESPIYTQGFIYTVEDRHVKLFTRFGGESEVDSRSIIDATIMGGLLVLERSDRDRQALETDSYRWNGDSLA